MSKTCWFALALAGVVGSVNAGQFAHSVVEYNPGSGYAVNYTRAESVLGEPSRVNPFNDATDPFNPAYGTNQILSIGEGGSLTVAFAQPILNHPNNLFGLDFIVFGNSGFIITNDFDLTTYNWIGIPATDGSLFAQNTGATRVSVSRDGQTFYTLAPAQAPVVDFLFPTDGSADPVRPVDPILTQADFVGLTLEQIRALYNGSAGGAAYDISWAQDANGSPVSLPIVNFIRVEVLSGKSEIDAFSVVARDARAGRSAVSR
jgi:hypothetical protein